MKTKTIGEILRDERLNHRLNLEDLSKKTRIRLEYLQALERNDFAVLPAATFVKGYIKTYAQIFGFDPQPLVALLRRDYKESAQGTLVPREFIKPALSKRRLWSGVTLTIVTLATLFVTLLGYVGFQWYRFNQPPPLVVTVPQQNALVAAQVIVEGYTSADAVVVVNAQPVSLQADGTFRTEVYIPREGIAAITVEALDRRGKSRVVQRTVYVRF